jgi:hypothetical protein
MSSTSSSLPSLPSSCSPQTARKLIEPVVAKVMEAQLSGRSEAVAAGRTASPPCRPETTALEVRTYAVSDDGDTRGAIRFVVELSARVSTLIELAPRLLRTLRDDLATVIGESQSAYMPNRPYDKHGSTVRRLANDYVTVRHVITTSDVEEVEVSFKKHLKKSAQIDAAMNQ